MQIFSTFVAMVYGLVLSFLILFGNFTVYGRLWTAFAIIYAVLAVASGWVYCGLGLKVTGWIHSALMLGVAGICGIPGLRILCDRSIAGGRGPDANPVAGMIYGFGLLGVVIGAVALVCGLGVIAHLVRRTDNEMESA